MHRYRFGGFSLDAEDRVLVHAGQVIALTPKATETLLALVRSAGTVLAKRELLDDVWPDQAVGESVLTQNIYTLRTTLQRYGGEGEWITTVPKRGYRFAVDVDESEGSSGVVAPTVAVLVFQAHPRTEATEALGLVVADAVVTHLGSLGVAVVHPRSRRLDGVPGSVDLDRLARRSGVSWVLTGTVQSVGEQVRLSCQLLECDSGIARWAERFEGATSDIFSLQDALCDAVSQQLIPTAEFQRSMVSSTDPETYRAYVRGYYLWNQRTPTCVVDAVSHFEEATKRDPSYAPGWAGLADALVLLPFYTSASPEAAFPQAELAAQRALALAPDLAQAHVTLAYASFLYRWDWPKAERGFRHALTLNPGDANAHHWFGFMLAALGREDEAIWHAQRAVELDPAALAINADLGFVLYFCGRAAEARRQFALTLELSPDFAYARFGLALALESCGQMEEALAAARETVRLSPSSATMCAALGRLLGMRGEITEARELLEKAEKLEGKAIHGALVLSGLKEHEAALDCLQRACAERSSFVVFLNRWPIYDDLRAHPRFADLVKLVGLPG